MEFLERMGGDVYSEQWLARDAGELRNAHVFDGEDQEATSEIASGTTPWLGFTHPRLVAVHGLAWSARRLIVVTSDERGTSFLRAAPLLLDDAEREAWAVAELAAIADALTAMAAHTPGFVHRRANTDEIVVGADGRARLRAPIAFAQSAPKAGFLGRPRHTPSLKWMSPELARGYALSAASDVFQLGLTLHCAIAGAFPFRADNDFEMVKLFTEPKPFPVPPTRAPGLAAVILRAVARDPSERYANPADFAAALRGIYPGEAPPAACEKLAANPPRVPPNRSPLVAGERCSRRWDQLATTDMADIRHCDGCKQDVVQVRSVAAVVPLLGRRCVSLYSDEN